MGKLKTDLALRCKIVSRKWETSGPVAPRRLLYQNTRWSHLIRWKGLGVGVACGTCRGIDEIVRRIFGPVRRIPRLGDMDQDGGFALAVDSED